MCIVHQSSVQGNSRQPHPETAQLVGISADGRHIQLQSNRGKTQEYTVELLPNAFHGVAARLTKPDGTSNEAFMAIRGHDICDCQGFASFGHCKHVDYVRLAWQNEQLPGMSGVTTDDFPVQSDPAPCESCGAPVDDPFDNLCAACSQLSAADLERVAALI